MKKLIRIVCALLIVSAMTMPASAQIVLSKNKGQTFTVTGLNTVLAR